MEWNGMEWNVEVFSYLAYRACNVLFRAAYLLAILAPRCNVMQC